MFSALLQIPQKGRRPRTSARRGDPSLLWISGDMARATKCNKSTQWCGLAEFKVEDNHYLNSFFSFFLFFFFKKNLYYTHTVSTIDYFSGLREMEYMERLGWCI